MTSWRLKRLYISLSWKPRWTSKRSFSLSAPFLILLTKSTINPGLSIRLWNLFNDHLGYECNWGFGILQLGKRHLFYVGSDGVAVLFRKLESEE